MAERKRKAQKKVSTSERVTAGTNIRIEQPRGKRAPKANVAIVVAKEMNPVGGFANFLRHYGVIGVAVGFAIASQAQLLIKSLIDNLINPLYSLVFNTGRIENQTTTFHFHGRIGQPIHWGLVVTQIVNFMFVLAIIYAIVKLLALDKLTKAEEDEKKK